jgi:twitching motility protein PilT
MKPLAEMLRHLTRPGVTEIAFVSGRCPMVKSSQGFEPVDETVLTASDMHAVLKALLGQARAADVSETPLQWKVRAEGLGMLNILAVRRGSVLQARVMNEVAAPAEFAAAPAATSGAAHTAAQAPKASTGGSMAGGAAPAPGSRGHISTMTNAAAAAAMEARARGSTPAQPAAPAAPAPAAPAPAAPAPAPVRKAPPPGKADFWKDLSSLLEEARRLEASDLHVIAGRPPLYRLVGELQPRGEVLSPEAVEAMLLEVVPDRLRPVLDRSGSCDFAYDSPATGRFRVNVSRQRTGYKGTFRVIAREIPTLESLGLPTDIARATHHHQGLIVITGPSGHGKTSTLAAIVDIINRDTHHHVLTVEDPVEYLHPRKKALMSQREVGTHTKSFASALKGSLREDPDAMVVGELRDTETVRMALAASETGHLLITTMNTPSAAKTIDRLIDMFPPGDQAQVRMTLASSLRLIVSQRLLPNADNTGLVAAAELLPGSISLGNLIRDNKTYQIPSLQQRGKSLGIIRFDDSLAELVRSGKTTLETAKQYAENPDELEAVLTGKRLNVPPPEQPSALEAQGARLLSKMGSLLNKKGPGA